MALGYLTTHVLDTARGCPAGGMTIHLYRIEGSERHHLQTAALNGDGRGAPPRGVPGPMRVGIYELVFEAGAYLRATSPATAEPRFLDQIPIRFGIADEDAHYHVPLLLAPFGYSTYRGS